jgi:hypothetical protein
MTNPALCSASPAAHLAGSAVFATCTQQQRSCSRKWPGAIGPTSQAQAPFTFSLSGPHPARAIGQNPCQAAWDVGLAHGAGVPEGLVLHITSSRSFGVSAVDCSAEIGAARAPAAVGIQSERNVIGWLDHRATNLAIGSMIQSRANHRSQLSSNVIGPYYSTDERTMQPATVLLCPAGLEISKARAGEPRSLAPWPERCYNGGCC